MATDAPAVIVTERLTKQYGTSTAVSDLTVRVRAGEIYGFLGPNGAGKTTTMLMLLGIERPTRGQFTLFGQLGPGNPFAVKRRIGVVAEHQHLPDDQTAWEYLLFFGRLYGVEQAATRAAALLERLHLTEFRQLLARDYSRGMQQKLGLARALLHQPELLILDEPVSGLDPHGIRQVRELLQDENRRGVTVLVSSHILSEVERTADRVGILNGGRLVAEDSVAAISARLESGPTVTLELDSAPDGLVAALRAQPYVRAVDLIGAPAAGESAALRVRLADGGDHRRDLSALVVAHGRLVTGLREDRLSLEDAFVRLTTDNVAAADGRRLADAPAGRPVDRAAPRRSVKRRSAR